MIGGHLSRQNGVVWQYVDYGRNHFAAKWLSRLARGILCLWSRVQSPLRTLFFSTRVNWYRAQQIGNGEDYMGKC